MADVLRLSEVRKSYGGGKAPRVEVLHGIDLVLAEGEFSALTGPSGSGKSTLLNIIGLLESPTSGDIMLAGEVAAGLDDDRLTRLRNRYLGFIFQFHHLLPAFSALENVLMPVFAGRGRIEPAERERARQLLERVGLADHAHKQPVQLSGGQQQRVAIVRALMARPRLVLADEPTGNLDTRSAADVFGLLHEINRSDGVTFLIVTHDPRLADACARRIELEDGRVVRDTALAGSGRN
ncbi:ABC transporter ATP-binding protein [Laribacter hongkongensis]|uniref:ABC transporter ATP-binding protein n=1 Tax=Laribacter hongkongensis TaxID=168471 RepID=A0ABD4SR89_9NEIS|nr:ABC transporter ATP-binding protein [Laribacter hongkongensis]MCG9026271.1 ABC transporter ATP-binding protein [Laribacter hongkongensis]MCG9059146.1 ABC transporter ATP-binding protein [Laribacter hongkongensis]MCG9085554.1 ABC transporter ATP-binding protein [Laribacter hongkongensis]MCG9099382.1 ABC transporter ATP-binding protein [Laribacter hongkongensis]MCG9102468.1 ABC transporter ATP-binding protein [Laribacter hongkongensis]